MTAKDSAVQQTVELQSTIEALKEEVREARNAGTPHGGSLEAGSCRGGQAVQSAMPRLPYSGTACASFKSGPVPNMHSPPTLFLPLPTMSCRRGRQEGVPPGSREDPQDAAG